MRKEPSIRHYAVVNMPLDLLKTLIKKNSLNVFLNKFLEYALNNERHLSKKPMKYTISYLYEKVRTDILIYVFCKND